MKETIMRKLSFFVCSILVLCAYSEIAYAGVLRKDPVNPRYLNDGTKTIYLTGSHTWFLVQKASFYGQMDNSYQNMEDYLNWVQSFGHNFQRVWVNGSYYQGPFPWARTGPGTAWDGGLKFNMSQFDQSYFDMLRQRVLQITNRGMYCSVMLFGSGNAFRPNWPGTDGSNWSKCSWNPVNNINSALASALSTTNGNTFYTSNTSAMDIQKALIRKTVDTLNDIDNLMWEIINEPKYPESMAWQEAMASYVRSYESGKAKQHLVGMVACGYDGGGQLLLSSSADWMSPDNIPGGYKDDGGEPTYTAKVIINDTDHLWGFSDPQYAEDMRKWVWKTFTSGHHPIFMDTYDACFQPYQCGSVDTRFNRVRAAMGHTLAYANKMDLVNVTPQPSLASTGYCLAKAGYEYLVYFPSGGSGTLNLAGVSGDFSVKWFNPYSGGSEIDGGTTTGGAVRPFTPPFSGDAVLYLVSGSGTPPTCNITSLTLINADTDQPVSGYDPITDGATLNLDTLPTRNLNVRANTDPSTIGSVRFGLDGNSNYRTESGAPYALAGDASGDYYAWTPAVGSHVLTATPYTGAGATGTAGTTFTINFSVTDQSGVPVSGLVGHWKFDEGSGTSTSDSSGSGNTGTLQSGPVWTTGKFNGALNFDGVDDAVNVGSNAILDDIATITIAAWIKPDSIGETYGRIFGKEYPDSGLLSFCIGALPGYTAPCLIYQRCWTHGSGLYSEGLWITNNQSITLGQWQHVAVTYDARNINNNAVLYLNGVSQTNMWKMPTSGSLLSDAQYSGIIGNEPNGGRTFDGVIDDVRIYNRVLSPSEVLALYNGGDTSDTTPPGAPASVKDGAAAGVDISTTTSRVQLSANWTASVDAESGISGYQYAVGTTAGGTQTVNWTTIGNVLTVTKTGLTLTAGTTYYFSVKAVNGEGLTGTAANSNGQVVISTAVADTTPPGAPATVRDGPTAGTDASLTYSTTILSANWTAAIDNESGITNYQFSIGTTPGGTQTSGWATIGNVLSVTKTGLSLSVGTTYYFSVKAVNGAGLSGPAANSNGQYVRAIDTQDTTPPSNISQVNDGGQIGTDADVTYLTDELSANWDSSADAESGVSGYYFAIGSLPGATDITNWKDNGALTEVTETGLTLTVGATYYFSVKAENGVGLQSAPANSNGQFVLSQDTQGPLISNVSAQGVTNAGATITWQTDEPSTSRVEYGLTVTYGSLTGEYIGMNTSHSVSISGLQPQAQYHFRVISRDYAGNVSASVDYTFTTLSTLNTQLSSPAYPNPYDLSRPGGMKFKVNATSAETPYVSIYTISGKLVIKLTAQSGINEINWDGRNEDGQKVTKGIYLYTITQGSDKSTGKLAVLK